MKKSKLKEKRKGLLSEFKAFITRGNVVDMATGVIVASAFTAIVTALTQKVIMPFVNWLVSLITNGEKVLLATVLNGEPLYVIDADGIQTVNEKAVYIDWSAFIEAVFNFFIIALIIFAILKVFTSIRKGLEQGNELLHKKEIEEAKAAAEKAAAEKAAAEAAAKEEQEKVDKEKASIATTNELLIELINVLKEKN